ncbi:MAG: ATP-binding protein [Oscillospiraceae bacterium]|nr:ATP-binding protein [Oscillospiraceae bacterium]
MLPEISLNILDVAQNSIRAEAGLIEISIVIDTTADTLEVVIKDNGCGMTREQVEKVIDPFFTTRTTRKIGLGIPFFKFAAESTGGSFEINSAPNAGTTVRAVFMLSSIDRMPLGDISATIHALVTLNEERDFVFNYSVDGNGFSLDTRELKKILGDISFNEPEVSKYIRDFLIQNKNEIDGGTVF